MQWIKSSDTFRNNVLYSNLKLIMYNVKQVINSQSNLEKFEIEMCIANFTKIKKQFNSAILSIAEIKLILMILIESISNSELKNKYNLKCIQKIINILNKIITFYEQPTIYDQSTIINKKNFKI